jgi:hypothetical protein
VIAAAVAVALAVGAGGADPGGPSVAARVERTEVRLGEPFGYAIEIRHPPEERYALPPEVDLPPFHGRGGECRRLAEGAEARTTCALRLVLFDLGPHDIPAVTLRVETAAGATTLSVPGPRVTGVGLADPAAPPEALRLRDPAPPVPLLVPTLRPLWWALGALGAVVAALLVRRALGARARAAVEPPAPVPPEARLAARLDALAAGGLPERGRAREFFFELSAAAREYLGAVTGVPALDLTTSELLERLAASGDPRLDLGALRRFSEEADLVKFAGAGAPPVECAAAMQYARGLPRTFETATATATATATPSPTLTPSGPGPGPGPGPDPGRRA